MPPFARLLRLATVLMALTAGAVLAPSAARAAGSPAITLHADAPAQVLYGTPATVTLTAADPGGQPTGYNLTFRDVLPAGISYVPGSSHVGGASVAPQVLTNAPSAGKTTLIWSNVSDLSPSSSAQLTYQVSASTGSHSVLDSYTEQQAAYVNTDPRTVPAFNPPSVPPAGTPVLSSATGTATASSTTQLSALAVTSSDDAGGELLRGVHDHQTVYTVNVTNNSVASTTSATLDTYLPAGLEFLGCGQQDHTTDTLTNPASAAEYAGAGSLGGHLSSPAGCGAPTEVQTGTFTPGTLPSGVYTHVQWSLGTLAAGQTVTLRFVAGIPLLENEDVWPDGKPTDAGGAQAANLDNNQGDETFDGESLPTFSTATGQYGGTLGVSAGDTTTVVAKNIIITESVDHPDIAVGSQDLWSFDVQAGEYKYLNGLQVSATLPDGVCPVDTANHTSSSECAPDGRTPSSDFTQVHENGDGTWSLAWDESTDSALARLAPDATTTITVPVTVRSHYGNSASPTTPILAGDRWTGTSQATGDEFARCAPADPTCTLGQPSIFDTEAPGLSVSASSSAGQSVSQPVIAKQIDDRTVTPLDCATDNYVDTAPTYHPGDKVCFKLHIDFPSATDTGGAQITDFLPPGTAYDTGSLQTTPSDTVSIGTVDATTNPGVLAIPLGSGGAVDKAQILDAVYSVTIVDPTKANQGDVQGNLMKFANTDTGGTSFPQRAQASYTFAKALLTTTEGVDKVNGAPAAGHGANDDGLAVGGGDLVTVRVDVTNSGGLDASSVHVTEDLPGLLTCAATSAVSDGGSCVTGSPDTVQWTGLSVPAGQTKTVFYTYAVPHGQLSGVTLDSHAGVVSYQTPTDTGTPFTNIPANNIDPGAGTANTAAADDTTNTILATPVLAMSDTTSVTGEAGNNGSQATIGERIDETATITLPGGVAEGSTTQFQATIPSGLSYVPNSVTATLDGASLPAGWTVGQSGGQITLTAPAGYEPASTDTVLVHWSATVDDSTANTRTGSIAQPGTFQYDAVTAGSVVTLHGSVSNAVVEPNLHASLSSTATGLVSPGQALTYTATLTNTTATGVSTANHLTAVVTVPAGETPIAAVAGPIADGGTVAGGGNGVWSQTARTITFPIAAATQLAAGASSSFAYNVTVDAAQPSSSTLVDQLTATATSLKDAPTAPGAARTATTAAALSPPVTGYGATASSTITLVDATVAKTVSVPGSSCSGQASCDATIGDAATYTLQVTIPSGIALNDAVVRDAVPDGVAYDGLLTAQCTAGCALPADIPVSEIPAHANGDGTTTLGFWLGEVASSGQARTVTITYAAHVLNSHHDSTPVSDGQSLAASASVDDNQAPTLPPSAPASVPPTSAYSYLSPVSAATLHVTEPSVAISTGVTDSDGLAPHVDPGDDLTFTITVTNNGSSTAYQVPVTDVPDVPDARLVIDGDEASLAGGGDLTQQWTSSNGASKWLIPSLSAHQSVTLRYTATLVGSGQLSDGSSLIDTATLGAYAGVSPTERTLNPGFVYRPYTGASVPQTLTVELPTLTVDNTTGDAGFPETAHAQVGQAFGWRVVVTNANADAPAPATVLTYTLPANWHYVSGSAGSVGDPHVDPSPSGDTLTWQLHTIAAGVTLAIPFQATPSVDAEDDPGSGAAHLNQSSASIAWTDGSGATASNDGGYADGPDFAAAQLDIPALTVAATPKAGTFTAGQTGTWTIVVHNGGDATAHQVLVSDAIPAGDPYAAGTATASPAGGFSETQNTATGSVTHLQWTIATLAAGDSVTITVPTAPPADTPDATTFSTPVSAVADEVPGAVSDTADATVHTSADAAVGDSVSPSPAAPGTSVTYTLTATDNGPSDAQNVTLTDTLDPSETFQAFTSGGADCTQSGQQITCTWPTLAAGASHQIQVQAALHPDATGSVPNHATITTSTPDTVTADDHADAPVSTVSSFDLSLSDSADAGHVLEGGTFHYTLSVTNHGPSDATGVSISDQLPAGVTFVSADGGCTASAGVVTCAVGGLAAKADRSFVVTVQAGAPATITDAAVVSSASGDTDHSNDSAAATVQIDHAADLSVAATGPATVAPDQNATYLLTAADHGPSDATGVIVSDTLPDGLIFVSATSSAGSCTHTGQTISCAVGPLANGDQATVTVVAHAPYAAGGQTLTDAATVAGDQGDPVAANNHATVPTSVGPAAGMAITDQVDNPTPGQQRQVTYTLTYSDHGPTSAHGIVVTDTLPAGVTFVSTDDPGCTQSASVVTCLEAPLSAGATATIHVVVTAGQTGTQQDAASVTATEPDPDLSDNQASAPITVGPTANLTLQTATSTPNVPVGGIAVYTLAVTNHGPSDAHDVTITVPLTAGAQLVGATIGNGGSCAARGSVLVCTVPFLAAGDTATASVQIRPGLGLAGTTLLGSATVGAREGNAGPAAATAGSVTMAVGPAADTSIVVSAPSRVSSGGRLQTTLTVRNHGPQPSTATTVTATLPAGVTLVSARTPGGRCSSSGRTLVCHLGTVAPGAVKSIVVTTTVTAHASATLTAIARVTAGQLDPTPANNHSAATTRVDAATAPARLRVSESAGAKTAVLGHRVGYTITVTNRSHVAAGGVVALDRPSGSERVLSVRTPVGSCHGLRCALGRLAPGQQVRIHVVVEPMRTGALRHQALVTSDHGAGGSAQMSHPVLVQVRMAQTHLAVAERAMHRTVLAGGAMTYLLSVRNAGHAIAAGVTLCDAPSDAMTLVVVRGARFQDGRPCWTIPALAPGAVTHRRITVRFVGSAAGRVLNHDSARARNASRREAVAAVHVTARRSVRGSEGVTG